MRGLNCPNLRRKDQPPTPALSRATPLPASTLGTSQTVSHRLYMTERLTDLLDLAIQAEGVGSPITFA